MGAPTPHRHPSSAEAQRDRGPLHSPNSLCGVRASSSVGLPRSLSQAHVQRHCAHTACASPLPASGASDVPQSHGQRGG